MRLMRTRTAATATLALLVAYVLAAYVAAPGYWSWHDEGGRVVPSAMITTTPQGIAGDPINVGFVGAHEALVAAFVSAGWAPADAITLRTAIDIGVSVLLDRPYAGAPVSTLLYDGRRQDLAFEKPVGDSPDQRHHIRIWQISATGGDGEPVWLGAASFDRGVGFSHDTGQITHHIGPDLDAERALVMHDLQQAGMISRSYAIAGVGATRDGRNGGGDPYFTDGKAIIGILSPRQ